MCNIIHFTEKVYWGYDGCINKRQDEILTAGAEGSFGYDKEKINFRPL